MSRGPITWVQPVGPPGQVFVAERAFLGPISMNDEPAEPYAGLAELLYGGRVYQTTPKLSGAPLDLDPESFTIEMSPGAEEEWHGMKRARALSKIAPVTAWLPYPIEDRWIIPATAKTIWTMSRNFGFSLVPYNAGIPLTVPKAYIEETPGDVETRVPLTLSASSPPGSGEFYVNTAADGFAMETLDLSGTYAGRALVLRYYPKRLVRVGPIPNSMPEVNGLDTQVTLDEVIPPRTYA